MKLAKQQSQFIKALFSLKSDTLDVIDSTDSIEKTQQGLAIYQNNLRANAHRALAITYPSVSQLLGANVFGLLAELFLLKKPKEDDDWGTWGQDLASFISQQNWMEIDSQLIADMAKLDNLSHQINRCDDKVLDLNTVTLLNQYDAYQIVINWAPGFNILNSKYPLEHIKQHLNQNTASKTIVIEPPQGFDTNDDEFYFVLWRPKYQTKVQMITRTEYLWLQSAMQYPSLGHALDQILANSTLQTEFSFTNWLPKAIEQQQIFSLTRSLNNKSIFKEE